MGKESWEDGCYNVPREHSKLPPIGAYLSDPPQAWKTEEEEAEAQALYEAYARQKAQEDFMRACTEWYRPIEEES